MEAHLDGKWLLRTSDLTLTGNDPAAAYKQLIEGERGWRDFKSSLGLRPVFHHAPTGSAPTSSSCWLARS